MGKIEIDHTGSGGGITLSSDGTSLLLGGTAIGGSALELYAENPSTPTAPSAGGDNSVAIGFNASTSSGSTGAHSTAIGYDAFARNQFNVAIGYDAEAGNSINTGNYAAAFGNEALAYATRSVALGKSRTGGADSFAAAIANNTSSYGAIGLNSVAIGKQVKATATQSLALVDNSTASGQSSVAIGSYATASATSAVALGSAIASANYSVAIGGGGTTGKATASGKNSIALGDNAKAVEIGKFAFASNGGFDNSSNTQLGLLVLRSDTTDATAEALTSDNSTASTNNQIILPNNSAYAFHGTIVARQQASGGTASAAWKIEGLIRREGSAGTTVLVNSATTVLDNTPSWGMALSADTTNGGLKIEVTGAASTNIRWVATIHTSEVTYA